MQNELPLESDLLAFMTTKKRLITWRRAHERIRNGRLVRVGLTVMNRNNKEHERLLNKQLPDTARRPVRPDSEKQIKLL